MNWPVGLGGKGNEGVAGLVKQTPGSIGYVELIYAVQNKMEYGSVKNTAGNFVKADFTTRYGCCRRRGQKHARGFPRIHHQCSRQEYVSHLHLHLAADSRRRSRTRPKKKDIKAFLEWMLTTGQGYAQGMSYAPLPKPVVAKEMKQIALIK